MRGVGRGLPHHRRVLADEFGTRFEVANCSICLHWLSAVEDGGLVFSAGYKGCHVVLKVRLCLLVGHPVSWDGVTPPAFPAPGQPLRAAGAAGGDAAQWGGGCLLRGEHDVPTASWLRGPQR